MVKCFVSHHRTTADFPVSKYRYVVQVCKFIVEISDFFPGDFCHSTTSTYIYIYFFLEYVQAVMSYNPLYSS